jgi:hypothetical protein
MRDRSEILNDYLLAELPEAQRKELLREIEGDEQLSAELAELAPLVSKLEELPEEAWDDVPPPPLSLHGARSPEALPAQRSRVYDLI